MDVRQWDEFKPFAVPARADWTMHEDGKGWLREFAEIPPAFGGHKG